MTTNLVGTKLGNYRLERLLGRGRMGVVYLARDEALLRATAVKILCWSMPEPAGHNPEAWFISEARSVARVNHPHVVQIYAVARHGSYCYIAMEYVAGVAADAWIAKHGPFSAERATEILLQTAGALQAAHDAKVIHRDVKPENLLLGTDGKAKLGDFGMALYTAGHHSPMATRAGTPHYTAPEIWRGEGASPSTDIYALGATYYYLMTGRPPFTASDVPELMAAHLESPVPQLCAANSDIPMACQRVLERCMAKTPETRYRLADAVARDAQALLHSFSRAPHSSTSSKDGIERSGASPLSAVPPAPLPSSDFCSFFEFSRTPFSDTVPGGALPYRGEPFASLQVRLRSQVRELPSTPILVAGGKGTGRTAIVSELLNGPAYEGETVRLSCKNLGSSRSLLAQLLGSVGLNNESSRRRSEQVDAFVHHCLARLTASTPPLVVIDDCDSIGILPEELAALIAAARVTSAFRLIIIGNHEVAEQLSRSAPLVSGTVWETLSVRALDSSEVASYIAAWLGAARGPSTVPILFTPDATLLVALRSQGVLSRINQLTSNMLMVAAAQKRRILDSWDAWTAPTEPTTDPRAPLPLRPKQWPTADVLQALNQCRDRAGLPKRR